MQARIYRPAKTAMQSGTAKTRKWLLEFVSETPRQLDPLMGWTSSRDTRQQVKLSFASKEEAIAYCEKEGIAYRVQEPHERRRILRTYADNFRYGRKGQWTH